MSEKIIEMAQEFGDWYGEVNDFGLAFCPIDSDDKFFIVTQNHDGIIQVEEFGCEADRDSVMNQLEQQYDDFLEETQ